MKLMRVWKSWFRGKETTMSTNPRTYCVGVDYDVSVEDLVESGEFQWVAEEWHTSRFTSANYPPTQTGLTQLQMHLISCKNVSIQEGLNMLDSTKYRPATLHELLAFGAVHPMAQKEFRIVAP